MLPPLCEVAPCFIELMLSLWRSLLKLNMTYGLRTIRYMQIGVKKHCLLFFDLSVSALCSDFVERVVRILHSPFLDLALWSTTSAASNDHVKSRLDGLNSTW